MAIEYVKNGQYVEQVRLYNGASYLHAAYVEIDVPAFGKLKIDLSYGGNYYVIIEPQEGWKGLDSMTVRDIVRLSPLVRQAAQEALAPVHPLDSRINGVSHVMWCDKPKKPRANARNAVFYGEKAIDRSPCGTGSSARMAQLVAKNRLEVVYEFVHESIIGTMFDCRVESATEVGTFSGIMPSVAGWVQVIGYNINFVDGRDPLAHGFQLT